jgi:hypothetical protein
MLYDETGLCLQKSSTECLLKDSMRLYGRYASWTRLHSLRLCNALSYSREGKGGFLCFPSTFSGLTQSGQRALGVSLPLSSVETG